MKSKWSKFEKLRLFADQAEELNKTRLLAQNELKFGVDIRDALFGVEVKEYGIDEDDLRALLSRVRPFMAENEPVFFNGIYVICEKLIANEQVLIAIRKSRRQWKEQRRDQSVKLVFNKRLISNDENVGSWMNGFYFHHDKDKKTYLEGMSPPIRAISKFEFISIVLQTASQVVWVGMNVRYAFNHGLVGENLNSRAE